MRGFTLLETIVAIAVLTLVFLGPLAVATYALSNSSVSSNQVIAYNLAIEGMELIINKRDSLIFADPEEGWSNFNAQVSSCSGGCTVEVTNSEVSGCGSSPCPALRRDATSGIYSYDSSDPPSIFERRILISEGDFPNEKKAQVTIKWQEKNESRRSFTLERYVYNRI